MEYTLLWVDFLLKIIILFRLSLSGKCNNKGCEATGCTVTINIGITRYKF